MQMNTLEEESGKIGLKFIPWKSTVMRMNNMNTDTISCDGEDLEDVETFSNFVNGVNIRGGVRKRPITE